MKKASTFSREGYDCWMSWMLAVLLKPFIAVAFFLLAWGVSRLLWHIIPEGKWKTILYSPPSWLRDRER